MSGHPTPTEPTVIVAGARTPIGKLLGSLRSLTAADLGGTAPKGALEKARASPEQVDHLMGHVLQAGTAQNPARTAGLNAGLNAVATADQMIRAGEAAIIVAGGMVTMANAPRLLPGSREGSRYAAGHSSTTWLMTGSTTRPPRRRWTA